MRAAPQPDPERLRQPDVRAELQAAVGARRELGPEMEEAIVSAFLDRVGRAIDARVEARLAELQQQQRKQQGGRTGRLTISLIMAVPITAISGSIAGIEGMALTWAAIFLLNLYLDRR
ncbi:MAG TPA: hypothetical protein VIN09_09015 [Chloroflexota bacterium]